MIFLKFNPWFFNKNVNCFWFIGTIFCEENTRTTAVFIIKYLRTFGFKINDEVFAEKAKTFAQENTWTLEEQVII